MYISQNADPSTSTCYFSETGPNDQVFPTYKRSLLKRGSHSHDCSGDYRRQRQSPVVAWKSAVKSAKIDFYNRVYNNVRRYTTQLGHSCTEVVEHSQPVVTVSTATADHAHDRGDRIYN